MGLLNSGRHALKEAKKILPKLRDFPFRSIRARGMTISTGFVLLAVLLAVAAYTLSIRAYYYSAVRTSLESKAATASSFFTSYVTGTYSDYYSSASSYADSFEEKDSLELQFTDTSGRVEVSSSGISVGVIDGSTDVQQAVKDRRISSWQGRNRSTGEKVLAVSAPIVAPDGTVAGVMRYITSLALVKRGVSSGFLLAALGGLAVLALVIFSNLYFLKTITEPIASLTAAAERISEGSYGVQAEKQYDDEIGHLTDAINNMSNKLGQAERLQTEFISSVSHELRTPLTAIGGWCETIAYDESIQGDSRRGLEIISKETGRLTKLVEDLLDFTRIQANRFTLQVSTVDVPALVENSLFTYHELFNSEKVRVNYDYPEDDFPEIPGDPDRLSQVVLNILDNAIKYGKSGEQVDVSIEQTEKDVSIIVRDYGPGIPENELPHVKKKFYKGSSKERGNGIGLAVCDEIVLRHGGSLDIANAEGGGTRVTITLPKSGTHTTSKE